MRASSFSKPIFVGVLIAGLLGCAGLNGLRLYGAIQNWPVLAVIAERPGPLYIAITGGVFALGFLGALAALLFGLRGAAWLVRAVVVIYAAWVWIDRLVFTQSPVGMASRPFEASVTLILVVFALATVQGMER